MATARRCLVIPTPGGSESLELRDLTDPSKFVTDDGYTVGANIMPPLGAPDTATKCLRIATTHAGINYADICIRWGLYESAKRFVGFPITPGFEFAGIVEAVEDGGADSADNAQHLTDAQRAIKVGDAVFGVTMFGAQSTHVRVPRLQVFPIPAELTSREAASFPCVALTAYYALFELARAREGDFALVHSAAGGVGSTLCQLAKIAGCVVVGVVGAPHKVATARACGCDAVVDKSAAPGGRDGGRWWADVERACKRLAAERGEGGGGLSLAARGGAPKGLFNCVFDANGVATVKASYDRLAPSGRLVVYGAHTMLPRHGGALGVLDWARIAWKWLTSPTFDPMEMTTSNKSVMGFNLSFMFERVDVLQEAMGNLLRYVAEGRLKVAAVAEFPLSRAGDAHRALESAQTVGKLVLDTSK